MQFVKSISNLKPIQVVGDGTASIELDLDLIEPSSRIFLYKVCLKPSHCHIVTRHLESNIKLKYNYLNLSDI